MSAFPTDPEVFYRLRDDRTDRCSGSPAYQRVSCVVTVSPRLLTTAAGRVLLTVVCNLLSRWCRSVTIIYPEQGAFIEDILGVMRDADPFGTFAAVTTIQDGADVQVHLGQDCRPCAREVVVIDAGGWLAYLGTAGGPVLPRHEPNVLGAVAGACLGVAQVFKIALGAPRLRSGVFDLFRLSWADHAGDPVSVPEHVTVGRLVLVGAGSVGSSVAYCLRLAGVAADLVVVDKDLVGIENFSRSPIFGRRTFGLTKVEAIARALAGAGVQCAPFPGWWDEFVADPTRLRSAFDVWLPLANEHGVRWSMQNNVPPLMVHASTGVNWGVNFGRHIPGRGDCLVDRFPAEPVGASLTCSTGQVPTAEGVVDAALPFASLFAGLLVVADLVRLQLPGYPHIPNLAVLDFGGDLAAPLLVDRKARPGCICQGQRELTGVLRGATRYAALFGLSVK